MLRDALWEVVHAWSADEKRQFLKFVTGSERLPAPLSESIKIELPFTPLGQDEWERMLGMVPQSHTCSNTLELPNYWGACAPRPDAPGRCGATASLHVSACPPAEALRRKHPGRDPGELRKDLLETLRDRFSIALANAYSYGLDVVS